ncbi:MAG: prolipoprotein diacylglyceryl transferase [Actinomycetota bacterium]
MLGWKVIPRIGVGPLKVSPHGIGIALGYLAGARLFARRTRAAGLDENDAWNIAAYGVVGAIIGARAAYVLGHASEFSTPAEWLKIWEGGLSLIGGLLGGILAGWIYIRRHRLDFFQVADLGAPGLALGVFLGRSGDLAIGDHLGKPTAGWWGWTYRGGELISPPPCLTAAGRPVYPTIDGCIAPGITVHQTAIYDALWSLAILGLLILLERTPRRRGFLFLSWAGLYAAGRIVTDFLRVDKRWILNLTGSQITAVVAVLVCGFLLVRLRGAPPPRPTEAPPVKDRPADHGEDAPPMGTSGG